MFTDLSPSGNVSKSVALSMSLGMNAFVICAFLLLCMFGVPVVVRSGRVRFGISGCRPSVPPAKRPSPACHLPFVPVSADAAYFSFGWIASMPAIGGQPLVVCFRILGATHTFSLSVVLGSQVKFHRSVGSHRPLLPLLLTVHHKTRHFRLVVVCLLTIGA